MHLSTLQLLPSLAFAPSPSVFLPRCKRCSCRSQHVTVPTVLRSAPLCGRFSLFSALVPVALYAALSFLFVLAWLGASGLRTRGVHGVDRRERGTGGAQDAGRHQAVRLGHGHHPRRLLHRVSTYSSTALRSAPRFTQVRTRLLRLAQIMIRVS